MFINYYYSLCSQHGDGKSCVIDLYLKKLYQWKLLTCYEYYIWDPQRNNCQLSSTVCFAIFRCSIKRRSKANDVSDALVLIPPRLDVRWIPLFCSPFVYSIACSDCRPPKLRSSGTAGPFPAKPTGLCWVHHYSRVLILATIFSLTWRIPRVNILGSHHLPPNAPSGQHTAAYGSRCCTLK